MQERLGGCAVESVGYATFFRVGSSRYGGPGLFRTLGFCCGIPLGYRNFFADPLALSASPLSHRTASPNWTPRPAASSSGALHADLGSLAVEALRRASRNRQL
ncbi:MAG: hypothetical protein QOJ65_153 [Fimbriimonadaceae bacterium]|nr:hypothetical protein [Fimbriimonadaceae bacterium]